MLGSLYDAVERLGYSFKWENEIPSKTHTIDHYFYDLSVEKLKDLLNDKNAISHKIITEDAYCSDCGGRETVYLQIVYNMSDEDKQNELEHCLRYRKSSIRFIVRCLERHPDQKDALRRVLESKKLLIPELENKLK